MVDISLSHKDTGLHPQEVVFYAQAIEELPIIQRSGDIIRVHKATRIMTDEKPLIVVNMHQKASWLLFTGNDNELPLEPKVPNKDGTHNFYSYTPYNFSGKSYKIMPHEIEIHRKMKKWLKRHFKTKMIHDFPTKKAPLRKAIKEGNQFDLFGKIIELKLHDEKYFDIVVRDTTKQLWTATIQKKKFPHLKLNDVAKFRSISSADDNNLIFHAHSNILKFFSHAKIHKHMMDTIRSKVDVKAVVTRLAKPEYYKKEAMNLKDLFLSKPDPHTLHRVKFSISKIMPENSDDWAKPWDGEKYVAMEGKKKVPKGSKLRWDIKFIVKDYNDQRDPSDYMIRLREGLFFHGMKPSKWLDPNERKKAMKIQKILLNFKANYLDCLVAKEDDGFYIRRTFFNSLSKPRRMLKKPTKRSSSVNAKPEDVVS